MGMGILKNILLSSPSTYNERAIWGYQDFLAGAITTTNVTLNTNSNGVSAIFDSAKLINSSAALFRQDGISYAFTGTTSLFSSKITVVSQVGATITLNGIPNASWGTLRIWFQILSTTYPQDYTNPPLTVQSTVVTELGTIFEEEENKVTDFTVVNNILYPSALAVSNALALKQNTSAKDATGGYAGLTLFKINFKNVANTFTSFFTNLNTAARTYTFQDRNGTILDDTDLGNIGLALSVKQDSDPTLTGLAATSIAANQLLYGSGLDTFSTTPFTSAARTLLDDNDTNAMLTTLAGGAASTGSGGLVRATSPALVTPALGTPASGVLTNCTGYTSANLPLGTSLQTIGVVKTDTASTTSSTYAAIAGIAATITPGHVNNEVRVTVVLQVGGTALARGNFQLFRGATKICNGSAGGSRTQDAAVYYSPSVGSLGSVVIDFVDSPAANTATTYSVKWSSPDNVSTILLNRTLTDTNSAAFSRTASTIILTEIKG